MAGHSNASLGARHPIHNWEYADAAARTGASGFISSDIGKVAKQDDNNTYWILTVLTPVWVEITDVGGGGSIFGTEFNYSANTSTDTTTSTSWVEKLSFTTPSLPAGSYLLWWYSELAADDLEPHSRVQVDGVDVATDISTRGTDIDHFSPHTGWEKITLTAATHQIDIDYHAMATDTAKIRNARVMLWRLS